MGTPLIKHRVLMDYQGSESTDLHTVLFAGGFREGTDGAQHRETLGLDPDLWREMGEPQQLTVTIEPGDLLNTEEAPTS